LEKIAEGEIEADTAAIAREQTDGIGSRANHWSGGEGNFFASCAFATKSLPEDIPASSFSIYFAFLMKQSLVDLGEKIWLKWPNDLYKGDDKVGGIITKKVKNFMVVGIGVNLKRNQYPYSSLDTDISPLILLNIFLGSVEKRPSWKQVFSQYKIEFTLSKSYFTHQNGQEREMKDAILLGDGSLEIEGEKVYSLR